MKISLKYSGKTVQLSPYNTSKERDVLVYNELTDEPNLEEMLNILGGDGCISDLERKAIILKLREISVGEEVPVKFVCDSCKTPNDTAINISDVIEAGTLDGDIFEVLTDDNIDKFTGINIDELDIDEYDKLKEHIEENQTKFNFIKTARCQMCSTEHKFDISDTAYISKILSEDSILSLYQSIGDLVFFGHYTKEDVDGMLPFERSIYIGILNKTREELNK